MNWKVIFVVGATLLSSLLGVKVISNSETDSKEGRIFITLRKVGHEILLHYGDSSSRILPVEKLDDHTYLIKFEAPFSFTPDRLIKIIDRFAKSDHLPEKYLVEVIDGKNEMINYSYEISDTLSAVTHCVDRSQPKGKYYVKIQFEEDPTQSFSIASIFPFMLLPLAIVLLITGLKGSHKKSETSHSPSSTIVDNTSIQLGDFTYSIESQVLRKGSERIELSAKEAKILGIFASHPNEVLSRDDLLKEVWENEGVFVGRSLDVFVSKLRKKLQSDPRIRIVNIHGKGYKLEV